MRSLIRHASETACLTRARNGDRAALGEIYRRYQLRIFRFVRVHLGNTAEAEDITQMTFLRFWRAIADFSEKKGSLAAYLFTIARHLVIDLSRKHKEVSLDVVEYLPLGAVEDDGLEKEEERAELQKLLTHLSDEEKTLVSLRYFEDLSFKEIAAVEGSQEGAVRVHLHRILGKLRVIAPQSL
ncbi:sigma-70 family RNA polymerase sigma factor [Candidatus Gottesmanbacteria bacterium]|nr:sigma-70 family RNA polymerase sigma factor [Candidatus Gottesmanbacteria bacterium]